MKYLIKQREKRKGEGRGRETALYMVTQAYNPNTQGAETGASRVQDQPELHEILSQTQNKIRKNTQQDRC